MYIHVLRTSPLLCASSSFDASPRARETKRNKNTLAGLDRKQQRKHLRWPGEAGARGLGKHGSDVGVEPLFFPAAVAYSGISLPREVNSDPRT